MPPGQRALYLPWIVPLTDLAALSALLLDVTRVYMEMRPELRRVYARAADLIGTDPSCALTIGYLPLEGDPETVCMDFGPASVEPDITLSMPGDIANRFWRGKYNLAVGLARSEVKAKGPVNKILKLVPLTKPLFPVYNDLIAQKDGQP